MCPSGPEAPERFPSSSTLLPFWTHFFMRSQTARSTISPGTGSPYGTAEPDRPLAGKQVKSRGGKIAAPETVKKGLCPFLTKGLQSAARTICTPLAYKSHTYSLIGIFCQVHAPTENDQNPFAASGRQTLRGFFDTLRDGKIAAPARGFQKVFSNWVGNIL